MRVIAFLQRSDGNDGVSGHLGQFWTFCWRTGPSRRSGTLQGVKLVHPSCGRKEYTVAKRFEYKHPSPFDGVLLRIAKHGLEQIDAFFEESKCHLRSAEKDLEKKVASSGRESGPDDQWVDDFTQLEEFAWFPLNLLSSASGGVLNCIGKTQSDVPWAARPYRAYLNIELIS